MEGQLLLLGGRAGEGQQMGLDPHFAENKIAAHPLQNFKVNLEALPK